MFLNWAHEAIYLLTPSYVGKHTYLKIMHTEIIMKINYSFKYYCSVSTIIIYKYVFIECILFKLYIK